MVKDVYDYYLSQFENLELIVYSVRCYIHWRGLFIWVFFHDRNSRSKMGYARVRWGEACDLLQMLADLNVRWEKGLIARVYRDKNDKLCIAPYYNFEP